LRGPSKLSLRAIGGAFGCTSRVAAPAEQLGANDPINTKFTIDIISGTSAGGINGIYLAKALATESDLSQLQELWFNEGGIDGLLNDRASYATHYRYSEPADVTR
jgi:predicted acylesterase/phospholipase RssA